MSSREPIKAGIVGFGGSANVYNLPYILPNPDIEVYAFLQRKGPNDPNLGRFGHCTTKFPNAKHYSSADEVRQAHPFSPFPEQFTQFHPPSPFLLKFLPSVTNPPT